MVKKLLAWPPAAFIWEVVLAYGRTGVSRSAAALSYFLILTLFPLLMCINYFIGLFHLDLEQLVRGLDQVLPDEALTVIVEYLGYVSQAQSPALLWASLATIVLSASAGMRTLFQAMDELYQARRRTPFRRMVASVVLSLLFLGQVAGVREGTVAAALLVGQVARRMNRRLEPLDRRLLSGAC